MKKVIFATVLTGAMSVALLGNAQDAAKPGKKTNATKEATKTAPAKADGNKKKISEPPVKKAEPNNTPKAAPKKK